MADASLIEKIRKLIAKANDTSVSQAEAEAFNAKAHELMTRYNIDRATVSQEREAQRGHHVLKTVVRPYSSMILEGVCKLYYCKWFFRGDIVTIYGEEQNAAMCHAIAVMVLRAVVQESRRTGGGRSFMTGAAQTIHSRCLAMYNEVHQPRVESEVSQSDGRALVLLSDSEETANRQYLKTVLAPGVLMVVKKSKGARINNGGAFGAGAAFGNTVQLRRNLLK
jgi:hypothetical protein